MQCSLATLFFFFFFWFSWSQHTTPLSPPLISAPHLGWTPLLVACRLRRCSWSTSTHISYLSQSCLSSRSLLWRRLLHLITSACAQTCAFHILSASGKPWWKMHHWRPTFVPAKHCGIIGMEGGWKIMEDGNQIFFFFFLLQAASLSAVSQWNNETPFI